jgi:hypothetical protein
MAQKILDNKQLNFKKLDKQQVKNDKRKHTVVVH